MTSLGFENYAEALKIYLTKYREVSIFWRPLSVTQTLKCFFCHRDLAGWLFGQCN